MSPTDLLRFLSKPANTVSNHTALGLDNPTPVVTSSHVFQYPFFSKAEFSSARPDTLTGIGIFQNEGTDC
ncbi:hypothetical protein N7517_009736 [Penicillium concentricum]|uniref:Uncharacterized protein n=1 Tax=Penicillium concentricum TaxID=293559 RepID=A0A9W9RHZ6_9EURO|nr:uncharacterized protein N7517_009736 [Penicillium concentricum]KAJ5360545.1 hypothetical protein N7517_009736 [Penicillium concentricum]